MSGITVRQIQPGDGAAIARISSDSAAYYTQLAPQDFRMRDEEGLAEFLEPTEESNTETTLSLVAEIDGEVGGFLEASIQPPLESARWQIVPDLDKPRLYINAVGTATRFWRRGVATSLVEAAEAWGRERGAVAAVCDTYIGSPISVPFWEERMGYQRRAIIFRKPLAEEA
jgi:GNAT superfamily N-acetyltransferase